MLEKWIHWKPVGSLRLMGHTHTFCPGVFKIHAPEGKGINVQMYSWKTFASMNLVTSYSSSSMGRQCWRCEFSLQQSKYFTSSLATPPPQEGTDSSHLLPGLFLSCWLLLCSLWTLLIFVPFIQRETKEQEMPLSSHAEQLPFPLISWFLLTLSWAPRWKGAHKQGIFLNKDSSFPKRNSCASYQSPHWKINFITHTMTKNITKNIFSSSSLFL